MMKWIFLTMVSLATVSNAQAALDYGLELGVRQQAGDVTGVNISANSQTGMQAGAFVHVPLQGGLAHWRTGILYTQRPLQSENDITGEKIDFHLDYLDIPLDILFKPNENVGFYFGFNISINIAKSCSGNANCKVNGVNTPLFPFVFGVAYKFTPKWGVDFYIDGANSNVAKGLYDYRSVGLNLMYSFD